MCRIWIKVTCSLIFRVSQISPNLISQKGFRIHVGPESESRDFLVWHLSADPKQICLPLWRTLLRVQVRRYSKSDTCFTRFFILVLCLNSRSRKSAHLGSERCSLVFRIFQYTPSTVFYSRTFF